MMKVKSPLRFKNCPKRFATAVNAACSLTNESIELPISTVETINSITPSILKSSSIRSKPTNNHVSFSPMLPEFTPRGRSLTAKNVLEIINSSTPSDSLIDDLFSDTNIKNFIYQ
jgi:hypothetical protein